MLVVQYFIYTWLCAQVLVVVYNIGYWIHGPDSSCMHVVSMLHVLCWSVPPTAGDVESNLLDSFLAEIRMMKRLTHGGCPHVVNMVAASSCGNPVLLVMELAAYGSLLDYLRRSRHYVSPHAMSIHGMTHSCQSLHCVHHSWVLLSTQLHWSCMHACCQIWIVGVNCLPLQFLLEVSFGNVVNNGEMLDFAIQIAKGMVGTWIHPCSIYTAVCIYCTKMYINIC